MALTTTTLSSAVAVGDNSIVVASATGFAAGNLILVDQEVMQVQGSYVSGTTIPVKRGQDGTATQAHNSSANVTTMLASDEAGPSPQEVTQFPIAGRARRVLSYSAAGAITLPNPGEDMVAVINGTSILAMTLASPTKDMDGCLLFVTNGGKAAHTVTLTAGFGANTTNSDVVTFNASQSGGFTAVAVNGVWNLLQVVAGAATVAGPGLG